MAVRQPNMRAGLDLSHVNIRAAPDRVMNISKCGSQTGFDKF